MARTKVGKTKEVGQEQPDINVLAKDQAKAAAGKRAETDGSMEIGDNPKINVGRQIDVPVTVCGRTTTKAVRVDQAGSILNRSKRINVE